MLLVLAVWLSTSSAAYVGLMLFGLVAVLEWIWRAAVLHRSAPGRRGLTVEFWLAGGALAGLMLVILVAPGLLDPVVGLFDTMILRKTSSSSFAERNMWTATSWGAALRSYGIGVGVGSTRASSSVVGVVSSTGFLGAVRWSFLPPFATSLLIGISADFGLAFGFLYGLAAAVGSPLPVRGPGNDNPSAQRRRGFLASRGDAEVDRRSRGEVDRQRGQLEVIASRDVP